MLSKKKLIIFPTSRSIRAYLSNFKDTNTLLPFIITIDEFLKKSITLKDKKYCEEEQRVLFLNEAIKNTNVEKLGISSNFSKFLKQNEYIYRFFLELSSEKINIDDIENIDTYGFYDEHLTILKEIKSNYENILDKFNYVDKINLNKNYEINRNFIEKFNDIEINFEGYFTKSEFDIICKISQIKELIINFHSNVYNQKSITIFNELIKYDFKLDFDYSLNLTTKEILKEKESTCNLLETKIEGFSSRINQIAFIKKSIEYCVRNGINPSNIAVVLPDESFASSLQLFDNERYFNYAMGKSIKNHALYQVAYAISSYINEDEIKHLKNVEFLKLDKKYIEENIKSIWNNSCTKDTFSFISDYIKSFEKNEEVLEKYDELIYKLKILLFSFSNKILLKDVYKIFLQKLSKIALDDVNSGKVTVLGLLETRAVNFDAVIICDFNEEYIPKKSVKDKFLSTKIKEKTNLPTSFDRESLQKYYYGRLIDSTKYLFISYVNNDTNQISRFANELFKTNIKTSSNDNIYKHILYDNDKINYYAQEITDTIDLSKFIWSATSFKVYLQCKRKFYLQYILKIKEHDISLKPKGFELGDIIHSILEEYYKSASFNYEKIEELFNKYKSNNPFLILELEIWKKKLLDFYHLDKKRLENRKIIDLEKPFNCTFEDIKIKGVIDRIDSFEDRYEVIDYKTSSSLKIDTARTYENSDDFQLEFYYIAMNELYKTDKIDCYYYDLSNMKLANEEMLDKKLELLTKKFDELKEISKSEISFSKCEDKSTCQYCSYKIICNRE